MGIYEKPSKTKLMGHKVIKLDHDVEIKQNGKVTHILLCKIQRYLLEMKSSSRNLLTKNTADAEYGIY